MMGLSGHNPIISHGASVTAKVLRQRQHGKFQKLKEALGN
jgi:hypothetical protein